MWRYPALLCFAFACSFTVVDGVGAQSHLPPTTDVSVGFRSGSGGIYANREGATLDLVLGYRLGDSSLGNLIGGLTFGAQGAIATDLSCLILPDGGCAPNFPTLLSGGAFVGVRRDLGGVVSARALAGPAYHFSLDAAGAPGLQGSLDFSAPARHPIAVTAMLRQAALFGYRGETLTITSFGLGFRFQ